MSARQRKAIGSLGVLVFLGAYIWAAATVGGMIPNIWFARLAFYAIAGFAWGAPLIPLIIWMNRGR